MELLGPVLIGAVVIVAVAALAERLGMAAPLLLVLAGVGISFLPFVPDIEVDPELILKVVLPLLLYASAVNLPVTDLRRDFGTISWLSFGLVIATSVAFGLALWALIPELGLAGGIAIGAVISPTDAVATSIVRRAGAPHRTLSVLDGESLVNDASSLVILRSAIVAIASTVTIFEVGMHLLWSVVVAAIIGYLVGRISLWVRSVITNSTVTTLVTFIVPFAASIPTEHLGSSGLVAAVVAGIVVGNGSATWLRPVDRVTSYSTWRTVEMALESAVFLVMGLQLESLISDVVDEHDSLLLTVGIAGLGLGIVLVMRTAFVIPIALLEAKRAPRFEQSVAHLDRARQRLSAVGAESPSHGERRDIRLRQIRNDLHFRHRERLGWRESTLLVWAGMRGVVTLAAAQSLPPDFPHRSLLVLAAFTVAAASLLIQGSTIPLLVRLLGLSGGRDEQAIEEIDRKLDDIVAALPADTTLAESIAAQRAELVRLRRLGEYPSPAIAAVLRELDAEALAAPRQQRSADR